MKKVQEGIRWFLIGFVPTLCLFGLLFGLFFVWVNSRASLIPQQAALSIETTEDGWMIRTSETEQMIQYPDMEAAHFVERWPVLVPHSIRLLAWAENQVEEKWPDWEEYLRGIVTQ
ncbi:MAG: hypothetical protein ACOX6P_05250 [Candidatus Merdivicinus sp.]|jgi:hypothetical protein